MASHFAQKITLNNLDIQNIDLGEWGGTLKGAGHTPKGGKGADRVPDALSP